MPLFVSSKYIMPATDAPAQASSNWGGFVSQSAAGHSQRSSWATRGRMPRVFAGNGLRARSAPIGGGGSLGVK